MARGASRTMLGGGQPPKRGLPPGPRGQADAGRDARALRQPERGSLAPRPRSRRRARVRPTRGERRLGRTGADINIGDFLSRGARNPEHEALLRLIGALAAAAAASTDQPVAAHEMNAIEFAENAARLRAAHYREEGDRFRTMAEVEPIAALRRHLAVLARQYEQIAADLEPKARD
jgi:hypothetical protein